MISPSPGRIVWFYPDVNDGRSRGATGPLPLAAMVAKVIHDRCVNLTVSKEDGTTYGAQNIVLLQDGFTLADPDRAYAEWMPYQKGQAAKTEAAQAAAAPATDLQPLHAAIADLTAKTETAIAAPAAAIESAVAPVHAKLAEIEAGTQGKFEELGGWLARTFKDFDERLAAITNHPALEIPPIAPALQPTTTAIGASDAPGANLTAEATAAASAAGADPNVV